MPWAATDATGKSEFDPIAIDITRARISAFLHDEPAAEVSDDELKRFQDVVRGSSDPNAVGLVAWYAFKRRDYPQALDWFKQAIGNGGDAMIAHGLAHTLQKLDMKREAEEVAYAWREPLGQQCDPLHRLSLREERRHGDAMDPFRSRGPFRPSRRRPDQVAFAGMGRTYPADLYREGTHEKAGRLEIEEHERSGGGNGIAFPLRRGHGKPRHGPTPTSCSYVSRPSAGSASQDFASSW